MFSFKSSARNDCDYRRATNMVSIRVSFGAFLFNFRFLYFGSNWLSIISYPQRARGKIIK